MTSNEYGNVLKEFEAAFADGRLTDEGGGANVDLQSALKLSKELGRPLTDKEYNLFKAKERSTGS